MTGASKALLIPGEVVPLGRSTVSAPFRRILADWHGALADLLRSQIDLGSVSV
ncbi:hypothetical protein P12x_003566 [Tundrisphaera lichenicola]|uniref:hypothetical protein n=1 Tax=Tundrisphaera lichenicola TaxID=2029860 RepID=UPI003EBB8C98